MKHRDDSMPTDVHLECWLMLPWLVTGRIAASDRQRAERHLADCQACRDELEQQRLLCERIRGDDAVMLAPQASLQKLLTRIDGGGRGANAAAPIVAARRAAKPLRAVPRWLGIAAAVQTLAIAALLTLLWQQRVAEMSAPRFATASRVEARDSTGVVLRVVLTPQATNAELQSLLHRVRAQVIAGPTEAGVYSLQLEGRPTSMQVAQALEQVRSDANVIFAEHVSAEIRP